MSILSIFIIFRIILSLMLPASLEYKNETIKKSQVLPNYNILMYQCDICYEYFLTQEDLLKHLEYYHPQEFEDVKSLSTKERCSYFERLLKRYRPSTN